MHLNSKNNFDLLRILFAIFVMISHSHALLTNKDEDCLFNITHGQFSFSYIGLKGFFVISGYLIYRSILNSNNIFSYFWKRIIRIFPALITIIILTIPICYFFSDLSIKEYFSQKSTWQYLNNLTFDFWGKANCVFEINSVFYNNPIKAINGSLWTIPYEIRMYLCLVPFYFIKKKKFLSQILLIAIFGISEWGVFPDAQTPTWLSDWIAFCGGFAVFFFGGAFLATLNIEKLKNKVKTSGIVLISLALIITTSTHSFKYFFPILIPCFTIGCAVVPIYPLKGILNKIGDISYGVYLWGYFIQQMTVAIFKPNIIFLQLLSITFSCIVGWLSWHFIERKALNYKNLFSKNIK